MSEEELEVTLTIKDLNCSTCPFYRFVDGCPALAKDNSLIYIVGCASHPFALQVTAQPVIEELTTLMESCDKYDSHERGKRDAYDTAISLLEDEMNHERKS
jgi:hypothetical protein